MIEDEDNGLVARDVLDTRDLDPLEVDPQRESEERNDDVANHYPVRRVRLWLISAV